jgi:hypothetical protein
MNVDVDPLSLVSTLVEVGGIDTVYRDLYLGRAHTLLTPVISVDEFRHLERQHTVLRNCRSRWRARWSKRTGPRSRR